MLCSTLKGEATRTVRPVCGNRGRLRRRAARGGMFLLGTALVLAGGCARIGNGAHARQAKAPPPPPTISTEPIFVDQAMQKRDWSPSTSYYASGAVQAFSRRLAYELPPTSPPGWRR